MDAVTSLGFDRHTKGCCIGHEWRTTNGEQIVAHSAIDGQLLSTITAALPVDVDAAISAAHDAFTKWRVVPAPVRGAFVRRLGDKFRAHKNELAAVITAEVGKITQEALGEVQECIDICEFAVGLSRQLHGLTIASERPQHRMMEQWHPLGPIGVITAFNFPMAVWAWNAAIAFVCGDPVVWKPSDKANLCAVACHNLVQEVMGEMDNIPKGLASIVLGRSAIGQSLTNDPRLPLISATGSVRMGQAVAAAVAPRLGRTLLELGGNNAAIVTPSCDIELAIRGIVFSSVGTCGQRCTTLRRLFVHASLYDDMVSRLIAIYQRLPIGDPRDSQTLVGPLIDSAAADAMEQALIKAQQQGGTIHGGGRLMDGVPAGGVYVRPALVTMPKMTDIMREETFAPILYICPYTNINEAIAMNNDVPQGLSSALFSNNVREAEQFLSPAGSDCGIANINIGTSGAEIGGAFGGEKMTGGGRESGSDAWKSYMRRTTNTINYAHDLPLAQGISFDVK